MKYLLFFILLALGSLPLQAQVKIDSLFTAEQAKITELQSEIDGLKTDLKEHRIREDFFSDVIGVHGTWCGALIALLAVGIGFISWSRVKNAKDEVKREFDAVLKEHKEADEKFRHLINNDRINLKRQTANLCSEKADDFYDKADYDNFLLYTLESLTEDMDSREFFESLDNISQETMQEARKIENYRSVVEVRLSVFLNQIDQFPANIKMDLNRIHRNWELFQKWRLYYDEGEAIPALRKQIVAKLQPFFDKAEKKKTVPASEEV